MKPVAGFVAVVAVVVVAVLALQPEPDPDPPVAPTPTTAEPQPGTPGPPPTEALRRIRIDGWTWDAGSITLSFTNTGDVFVSGTAQCRVDFGISGQMAPVLPLHGLQPGEAWTETYSGLWQADAIATAVSECIIVDP